jgi:hypothetical protein
LLLRSGSLGYQWQRTKPINPTAGIIRLQGATLTITNVSANDVASYRCVVTNAYWKRHEQPGEPDSNDNVFGTVTLWRCCIWRYDNEIAALRQILWVAGLRHARFSFGVSVGLFNCSALTARNRQT